ncbi:hypothetical protein PENTCL1PPCAC_25047, partial [Pristionchus entomophagus]
MSTGYCMVWVLLVVRVGNGTGRLRWRGASYGVNRIRRVLRVGYCAGYGIDWIRLLSDGYGSDRVRIVWMLRTGSVVDHCLLVFKPPFLSDARQDEDTHAENNRYMNLQKLDKTFRIYESITARTQAKHLYNLYGRNGDECRNQKQINIPNAEIVGRKMNYHDAPSQRQLNEKRGENSNMNILLGKQLLVSKHHRS